MTRYKIGQQWGLGGGGWNVPAVNINRSKTTRGEKKLRILKATIMVNLYPRAKYGLLGLGKRRMRLINSEICWLCNMCAKNTTIKANPSSIVYKYRGG